MKWKFRDRLSSELRYLPDRFYQGIRAIPTENCTLKGTISSYSYLKIQLENFNLRKYFTSKLFVITIEIKDEMEQWRKVSQQNTHHLFFLGNCNGYLRYRTNHFYPLFWQIFYVCLLCSGGSKVHRYRRKDRLNFFENSRTTSLCLWAIVHFQLPLSDLYTSLDSSKGVDVIIYIFFVRSSSKTHIFKFGIVH